MTPNLTTNTYFGATPMTPATPPAPSITLPEPISYEFQVVEHVEDNKITKVALQVKRNIHDQYGTIKVHGTWEDVPRVRIGDVAPVV
jgi:hypothetical protein